MNKDLIAGQIRTKQIIADSKVAGKPGIVILDDSSSGTAAHKGEGYSSATAFAGTDVFLFVSGSKNSIGTSVPGITLFGGDIFVSGVSSFSDNVGMGTKSPTARLHLSSGTISAGTSPLKFTSGSLMTTPEPGATEFSGSLYFTNGYSERKEICLKTTYVQSLTPVSSTTAGYKEQNFTVTGLVMFDTVVINGPAQPAGVALISVRVPSANTIAVTFGFTGAGLTPATGTYRIVALR